jgi:competence protein ComFC
MSVYYLYEYSEIEPLLLEKHSPAGWRLWQALAPIAFEALPVCDPMLYAVAIDDRCGGGYSHTAILARALQARGYGYRPGLLYAQNRVRYAGRSKAYRLAHPRGFVYRGPAWHEAILVDDVVTTGLTMQEAAGALRRKGVVPRYGIALASVEEKNQKENRCDDG